MTNYYAELIKKRERLLPIILDSGVSTELERRGAKMRNGQWSGCVAVDDYEKLALKISNNSELLEKLKKKIKYNKNKSNLFKPKIFTENLEKAYIEVYQNYINGFEPRTIKL